MQIADVNIEIWGIFLAFVLGMLALDLGVFNRKAHVISFKEALTWSVVWIGLALLFNAYLFLGWNNLQPGSEYTNSQAGIKFLTGYVIEKSLSVDNIFVFLMVFKAFGIAPIYQHKVLFYGIIGALIFRTIFIGLGAVLISTFQWVMIPFGLFLIFTAVKMLVVHNSIDPANNKFIQFLKSKFPIADVECGEKFTMKIDGKTFITPLLLALVAIEFADIVFAVDSIPAIFAITENPFIVFTSNIFAILGLRSLYFCISGYVDKFKYLSYGLSAVLAFVGGKMVYNYVGKTYWGLPHFDAVLSLVIIVGLLTISIVASQFGPKDKEPEASEDYASAPEEKAEQPVS
jgi:tellurite resistance protein TerC